MSQKYPFLTAYVGFIALAAVLNIILAFIIGFISVFILPPGYAEIVTMITLVVVSFFVFRFVIRRNVLPYVSQDIPETTPNDAKLEID